MKASRSVTKRLSRRKTGGAPGNALLHNVKLAAQELNASLNDAQRVIVKNRLKIWYGSSETWKKLRNGNNNAQFSNSVAYGNLPSEIKNLVETLLDSIIDVFEAPYSNVQYNMVMVHLLSNDLYHLTQAEYDVYNNSGNSSASTNYSDRSNSNNSNTDPILSSPRSNKTRATDPKGVF